MTLPRRGVGTACVLDWGPADRPIDLVFLHATGFNALTYRCILEPLAATYRILAVDQRGHGRSTLPAIPDRRSDWYDFRDDLLALRQALNLEGVVLAGHSMGGTISLLAAAAEPRLARRLALFDPVILPAPVVESDQPMLLAMGAERRRAVYDDRAAAFASYRGRGAFIGWPDAMLSDYLADGLRDLPSGEVTLSCAPKWEASTYRAQRHDSRAAFAQSACPIEIYAAENDSACRFNPVAQTSRAASRITFEIVPATGHFLPMERPDLARAVLQAAIERV